MTRACFLAFLALTALPACGGGTLVADVAHDGTLDVTADAPDSDATTDAIDTAEAEPDSDAPDEVAQPTTCDQTGKAPLGSDPAIKTPTGVAVYGDRVFVTDPAGGKILKYTDTLTFVQDWGKFSGDPATGPFEPYGIAVDATDIYVTDTNGGRIVKATSLSATFEHAWGNGEDGGPDLVAPKGLALVGDELYVADSGDATHAPVVYVFSTSGSRLRTLTLDVVLKEPVALAVQGDKVLVADVGAGAIVVLATNGGKLETLDLGGESFEPVGLAVDGERLFVTDRKKSRLLKATLQNTMLSWCGGEGTSAGELSRPRGLAVLSGEVFLADYGNKRLVKIHP